MRKQFILAVTILTAGMMLVGNASAQQTAQPSTAAASTTATKTRQSTTAKPATGATKPATATTKPSTATAKSANALKLTTQKDKASYAIGLNIGRNLHKDAVEIEPNIVTRGIQDGLGGQDAVDRR